jgi:hypothetical protein
MSAPQAVSTATLARERRRHLLAGPRFPIMCLTALPAAVVALATEGAAQRVSGIIALGWLGLALIALYERWATIALPIAAAAFLVLTIAVLPFNSAAFVVDVWTTAAMFVLALPRLHPRRD